jgi:acyl-CoA thioesterase-1
MNQWISEHRRRLVAGLAASLVTAGAIAQAKSAAATILVLGDSLSAEYGLARGTGWVGLLEQRLQAHAGGKYTVVNASISGETTSGGLTRLPQLLAAHRPAIVIIELGANDGLRGLSLDAMRNNLKLMADAARGTGARVLLVGIRVPPNYGRDYADRFFASYAEVARQTRCALAPFLLDHIAEDLSMFQADRIHPNEKAQARMLDNVWPHLMPLLAR